LSWETFCNYAVLYSVDTDKLFDRRGEVTLERRRAIRALIKELFLLNSTD